MGVGTNVTILREEDAEDARREFELDVLEGLSQPQKRLSSLYFYDDIGSGIYQKITELDEYYLTRSEMEILEEKGQEIVDQYFRSGGGKINVVELGAGDGRKTKAIVDKLTASGVDFEYVPIDISRQAIQEVLQRMGSKVPLHGIVADYVAGLRWLKEHRPGRKKVVMFLGSTIGNFDSAGAIKFLRRIFQYMKPGDHFLIGTDLKKDPKILIPAYSDKKGITSEFNFNLLRRINSELGGDFDPEKFFHMASYNPLVGAMESWLIAREPMDIRIKSLRRTFRLGAFEGIHCEYSHKYTPEEVDQMGKDAGFVVSSKLLDARGYFMDSVWTVPS